MAKQRTLKDFLIEELKDLYSAEKQITKVLPKMAEAAVSEELKKAFKDHLKETENQISRLDKISKLIGKSLTGKKCKAMEGLANEGKEILEEDMEDDVRDVALICGAQKVEHYEMASYGCARTYAGLLGMDKIKKLLQETLDEEGNADKKLTKIAEKLNVIAVED